MGFASPASARMLGHKVPAKERRLRVQLRETALGKPTEIRAQDHLVFSGRDSAAEELMVCRLPARGKRIRSAGPPQEGDGCFGLTVIDLTLVFSAK
jgi:hypothetical protein